MGRRKKSRPGPGRGIVRVRQRPWLTIPTFVFVEVDREEDCPLCSAVGVTIRHGYVDPDDDWPVQSERPVVGATDLSQINTPAATGADQRGKRT